MKHDLSFIRLMLFVFSIMLFFFSSSWGYVDENEPFIVFDELSKTQPVNSIKSPQNISKPAITSKPKNSDRTRYHYWVSIVISAGIYAIMVYPLLLPGTCIDAFLLAKISRSKRILISLI